MTKKMPDNRRKLLKSIVVGGGAVVAGKALPEAWSKPVVDAVMLPAHAATTDDTDKDPITPTTTPRACCEAVFCRVRFGDEAPIGGYAQVSSDCTLYMEGDSEAGLWSGGGTVAADGSFSFQIVFEKSGTAQATGTISADCSTLSGSMGIDGGSVPFSATASSGITDIKQCRMTE